MDNSLNGTAKFVDEEMHGWIGNVKKGAKAVLAPELV
jgi:hypothetical protein